MEAPVNVTKSGKKLLIGIVIILLILGGIFFVMVRMHKKSLEAMKSLINSEASKYSANKEQVVKLITDTCAEIISDRSERMLAKKLSKEMSISYEQAVVDMAMGKLRAMKYLE
jgi:hypothetical protein